VFEKSETDEFFEELEKFISTSDDYGDSDTDGTTGNVERRATPSNDVGITNNQIAELGQDEHREKSPGFEDFFRIDDSDIQSTNRFRRSYILPTNNSGVDDDSNFTEANTRNVNIEKNNN